MWPPYSVYWDQSFLDDCELYPDEAMQRVLLDGLAFVVERDPYECSKALRHESPYRLMRTEAYFGDVPPMYVLLRIEKAPPEGVVALVRVRSVVDVRAGLDFVTDGP